jgi:peptidoglycan-associated lipoprotein
MVISIAGALRITWLLTLSVMLASCAAANNGEKGSLPEKSGTPGTLVADPRTPSSLEAMQKGLTSVTPPSSPLKDIFFDFDNYDLRADAQTILKANAEWLEANPGTQIEIEGHTDDSGASDYNLALGAKRAENARQYLVTLGVNPKRLKMVSYGEEAPACLEETEECRQKNRRARFVILTMIPFS